MTHEERIALIMRPFFITYFPTSYTWAGVITGRDNWYRDDDGRVRHITDVDFLRPSEMDILTTGGVSEEG